MTLTKEWLQNTIAQLEEERDAVPGAVNEDAANALAAMKLALASLEAEAVALRDERSGSGGISKKPGFNDLPHGTPLYPAPPAPVGMKDHQIRELVNELRDIAFKYHGSQQLREHIARTIRAAMLQGAEPVSNLDELPDGWVMVPVEPTAEMISSGIAAHYERNQIQIHDRPAPGPMECAYEAMLAAAPQQEVK
ncbi:hypothetical protein HS967_09615 [Enterobacter hormaechei]|uniref:hypothetical protein n=1 Tax=Enterobacter hormaechei TaxID=158836 RepID=UPI0015FD4AD6|nr:hypothetical protein [Enterobacter hormaechei]QMV77707.1 hypothetical protein HS967_09615 [Enterobacter hormaechei]